MFPGTRAKRVAAMAVPPEIIRDRRRRAVRFIHRGILGAHLQSIREDAEIALNYGKRNPYARVASQCIAKRILESSDLYPLSQADNYKKE